MNKIKEAIIDYWGEPCSEYDPDCPTCQVWEQFSLPKAFADQTALIYKEGRTVTIECPTGIEATEVFCWLLDQESLSHDLTSKLDDDRPLLCRERLQAEGKPFPKSNCTICGTLIRPNWSCPYEDK